MTPDDRTARSLVESDLEAFGSTLDDPAAFRADLRALLAADAAARGRAVPRRAWISRGRRAAVAVAAVGLLAGVAVAVLSGSSPLRPAPASAAMILRQAAAAAPAPGQLGHYVYDFTASFPGGPGASGTVDVWVDGSAQPVRTAQTVTLAGKGSGGAALGTFVQVGNDMFGYDASHDLLTLPSASNAAPSIVLPNDVYDGADLARTLAARGSHVVSLGRRTLDGVAVDAIQADGVLDRPALRVTLYFNAATHVLQGFDATVTDPSYSAPTWQVRLQSVATVAPTAAPTGTFAVPFPSGARVGTQPDLTALPAGCGIAGKGHAPGAKARLAAPGNTILATCQEHNPSLTAAQIVAALAAPARAQLTEAVAGGALTHTQAADALATLQGQLGELVHGQPAGLG
jgi:hypothetical protein